MPLPYPLITGILYQTHLGTKSPERPIKLQAPAMIQVNLGIGTTTYHYGVFYTHILDKSIRKCRDKTYPNLQNQLEDQRVTGGLEKALYIDRRTLSSHPSYLQEIFSGTAPRMYTNIVIQT